MRPMIYVGRYWIVFMNIFIIVSSRNPVVLSNIQTQKQIIRFMFDCKAFRQPSQLKINIYLRNAIYVTVQLCWLISLSLDLHIHETDVFK